MVNKTRWDGHKKNRVACIHKLTTSLIYFFALYDSLTERACKQIPTSDPCPVSFSDWLEFLIHIHSNRSVLQTNCSLMSEDVSSGCEPILLLKKKIFDAGRTKHLGRSPHSISIKGKHCCWKTFP